jgi:hypothetical protein
MSETNVGANLVFARRTKTGIKPMFENEFETIASDIGSQTIVVWRANTRFAPTLVSDIGWISITTIYPKIYDRLLRNIKDFANAEFIFESIKILKPENFIEDYKGILK